MKITKEYIEWNNKFSLKFGYDVPLAMISPSEKTEDLIENIKNCIETGKDNLQEIYKWKISKDIVY